MSMVVCQQGVHPCLESSHVVEKTTMRLTLVAPKCFKEVTREKSHDNEFGQKGFLQSLSFQKPRKDFEKESSYVHSWINQSSFPKLSQKSLELCTESLGSETGSDTSEYILSSLCVSTQVDRKNEEKLALKEEKNMVRQVESKKVVSRSFPPPLTTISGSKLIVKPHREGGRLIIQAMETPLENGCFQAERSHGRLRLTYWKSEVHGNLDTQSKEYNVSQFENDMTNLEKTDKNEDEDENENDDTNNDNDDEATGCHGFAVEEKHDVEVEMEIENFQRPRRCKEGGHVDKGLCNWEHFWVATS